LIRSVPSVSISLPVSEPTPPLVPPPRPRSCLPAFCLPGDGQSRTHAPAAGIKVFKVGDEAQKQAFVVGKTGEGKWAGLKTTVVET
jgi:hypothetical protein